MYKIFLIVMIMKWLVCKVEKNSRSVFSEAQAKWGIISKAPGFLVQMGGWDEKSNDCACILSIWSDQSHYDYFMTEIHDVVTNSNSQGSSYTSIKVDFFSPILPMSGKFKNLISAAATGKFLRVADCIVKSDRVDHFCRIQQEIWIPEMQRSQGMLGGSFNSGIQKNGNHFLVTSLWDSLESHKIYSENNGLCCD